MSHGRSGLAIGATKINASASPLASALAIGPPEWTGKGAPRRCEPCRTARRREQKGRAA